MATPLKIERIKKGIPQWRLANIVGIPPSELSRYELGRVRCPADKRYRIARVLEVNVDALFPTEQEEALRQNGDLW